MNDLTLIDFTARSLPPQVHTQSHLYRNGLSVSRHTAPSNPGEWMAAAQITIILHQGSPFDLFWRPVGNRVAQQHPVTTGRFHLTPANFPVHLSWDGEVSYALVAMNSTFLHNATAEAFDGNIPELTPHVAQENRIVEHLLTTLFQELDDPMPYSGLCLDLIAVSLALRLFFTYGNVKKPLLAVKGGLGTTRQRRIMDYIESHLEEDISLDDLAREAGISAYHLGRAFKQTTGMPPHRYITDRRIHRAQEMLLRNDRPVTDIALALGFASPSHFTDVFRKITGTTPTGFRQNFS